MVASIIPKNSSQQKSLVDALILAKTFHAKWQYMDTNYFFNQKSSITLGLKTKPKQKPMPSSMEKYILKHDNAINNFLFFILIT